MKATTMCKKGTRQKKMVSDKMYLWRCQRGDRGACDHDKEAKAGA